MALPLEISVAGYPRERLPFGSGAASAAGLPMGSTKRKKADPS
jgi:hypothetical protein